MAVFDLVSLRRTGVAEWYQTIIDIWLWGFLDTEIGDKYCYPHLFVPHRLIYLQQFLAHSTPKSDDFSYGCKEEETVICSVYMFYYGNVVFLDYSTEVLKLKVDSLRMIYPLWTLSKVNSHFPENFWSFYDVIMSLYTHESLERFHDGLLVIMTVWNTPLLLLFSYSK